MLGDQGGEEVRKARMAMAEVSGEDGVGRATIKDWGGAGETGNVMTAGILTWASEPQSFRPRVWYASRCLFARYTWVDFWMPERWRGWAV